MNAIAIRKKMDAFFQNVKPGEIVKYFEELGYEFEDIHAPISGDAPKEQKDIDVMLLEEAAHKYALDKIGHIHTDWSNDKQQWHENNLKNCALNFIAGAAYQHKVTQAETVERVNQYFDNLEYPDTANRADLITAIKQMKA
jgi:hypothetical protein